MSDAPPNFELPDFLGFKYPLPYLTRRLRKGETVKIVAIGSSSTAGEGGIIPYPNRLQTFLRDRYPSYTIDVLNRGVGGEEAPQELARFGRDVLAASKQRRSGFRDDSCHRGS